NCYVDGKSAGHLVVTRPPDYDGMVSATVALTPTPISTEVITVPAGSSVTAEWHHTLDGANAADSSDPIDASHKVICYLEDGLNAADRSWGVDRMIANDGKVTFTIPSCIEPGYLLPALTRADCAARRELVHWRSTLREDAFSNTECAQIEIIGGGSTSLPTVSFPGAYAGSDPGITITIYQTLSDYTIPGTSYVLMNDT
ncbi:hypothetical protein BDZ89DRAFT_1032930, partial [Hymenopellis radicata]